MTASCRDKALSAVIAHISEFRDYYENSVESVRAWAKTSSVLTTKVSFVSFQLPAYDGADVEVGPLRIRGGGAHPPRNIRLPVFERDTEKIGELLKSASDSVGSFDAAIEWSTDILRSGVPVPAELACFAADVLEGKAQRPKRRGRTRNGHLYQEAIIYEAIKIAISHGLSETRNDGSSHRESACDVVADALKRLKLKPETYGAVKKIWLRVR